MKITDPLFPRRILDGWAILEAALIAFAPVWIGLAVVLAAGGK